MQLEILLVGVQGFGTVGDDCLINFLLVTYRKFSIWGE
jgi:hypothetical protein